MEKAQDKKVVKVAVFLFTDILIIARADSSHSN